jgi:hypothetical protein
MGVSKKGKNGFVGKVGKTVEYDLNGQRVKRSVGYSSKPPTEARIAAWARMQLINNLHKPVKGLLEMGFKITKATRTMNANNLAMRYNLAHAITGDYPDLRIDFTKVLFAQGPIPKVNVTAVKRERQGILFRWESAEETRLLRRNDQVTVLAYAPAENEAVFQLSACLRKAGEIILKIPTYEAPVSFETYIFFTSASQKIASDSTYTGRIIW